MSDTGGLKYINLTEQEIRNIFDYRAADTLDSEDKARACAEEEVLSSGGEPSYVYKLVGVATAAPTVVVYEERKDD